MKFRNVVLALLSVGMVAARAVPQDPVIPAVVEPAVVIPADPEGDIAAQQAAVDAAAVPAPADVAPAAEPAAPADVAAPADAAPAPAAELPAAAPAAGGNVITFPNGGEVDASKPVTITWTPGNPEAMVTIALLKGPDRAQQEVERIASTWPSLLSPLANQSNEENSFLQELGEL